MGTAKIAITLDEGLLKKLDGLVRGHFFENRSRAVQEAVSEKIARLEHSRLARECAKLNPRDEAKMAEEGMSVAAGEWPEY